MNLLRAARLLLALLYCATAAVVTAAVDPSTLLDPEKAFRISARSLDERTAQIEFKIAEGYYMYRDRFQFATESGKPLADVQIPPGKMKVDPFFGKSQVFRDLVIIRVPVSPEEAQKGRIRLKVTSQGCSDSGVCYVPLEQTVQVRLAGVASGFELATLPSWTWNRWAPVVPTVSWVALGAALVAGLTLGWASAGGPRRLSPGAFNPTSLGRTVARSAAWGIAGGVAAWSGSLLEDRSENVWIAVPLAIVFSGFALAWMRRSHAAEAQSRETSLTDKALVAVPVLLFAAFLGEIWLALGALLGLGLCIDIWRGASPAVPVVRQWSMQMSGIAMLAAAVWIAAPLVPKPFGMGAWAMLFLMIALFCRAVDPLPDASPTPLRMAKGLGFIFLLWGIAVVIGAASGARDPLRPFSALAGARSGSLQTTDVHFERVATLMELEQRLASAGKPVMLDFYADWCVSCKEMERYTFSDSRVQSRMQRMLLLQADVTRNTDDDKALLKRFRLFGPPGIVFFDSHGQELKEVRVIGFQRADRFSRALDVVLERSSGSAQP